MNLTNSTAPSTVAYGSVYTGPFIFGTVFLATISIPNILLNVLNTRIFLNCGGSIPTRVRWFFVNCNLAYILRSVNLSYKACYNIVVLCLGGIGRADVPYRLCVCSEFLFVVGFYVGYVGTFFSSLERLYATCNLAARDRAGWTIGLCCFSVWILCSAITMSLFLSNVPNVDQTLPYCHTSFLVNNYAINVVVYVMLTVQASTCVVYGVIWCQNERNLGRFTLTSKNHDLASRFALWANVKAARWMLPVSVLHCVAQSGINLSSVIFRGYFKGLSSFYFAYLSIQYCVLAVEVAMHPLLCIRNNESFLRTLHDLHPSFIHSTILKHVFYGSDVANQISFVTVDVSNDGGKQSKNDYKKKHAWSSSKGKNPDQGRLSSFQRSSLHNAFGSRREIIVAKKIVDFRVNPDQTVDATLKMWNKAK